MLWLEQIKVNLGGEETAAALSLPEAPNIIFRAQERVKDEVVHYDAGQRQHKIAMCVGYL